MRAIMVILLALAALGATACGGDDSGNARGLKDKANQLEGPAQAQAKPADAAPADPETESGTESTPPDASVPQPVEGGDDNDKKIEISSADFPAGTWPLTIERGELRCVDTRTARTIIFSANGKDYPVNGVPEGGKIIGIEPIWKKKDDPQSPGTRMDITALFKKGYELCGN